MAYGLNATIRYEPFTTWKGCRRPLCAGMGEGGGVVPKIMEVRDDDTRGESDSKEN